MYVPTVSIFTNHFNLYLPDFTLYLLNVTVLASRQTNEIITRASYRRTTAPNITGTATASGAAATASVSARLLNIELNG